MYIWVSKKEAKRICEWAMGQGDQVLTDRFIQAGAWASGDSKPPTWSKWRSRIGKPQSIQCVSCGEWLIFDSRKDLERSAEWTHLGTLEYWTVDGPHNRDGWVHTDYCMESWTKDGEASQEANKRIYDLRRHHDDLFGLGTHRQHRGVLVACSSAIGIGLEEARTFLDEINDDDLQRLVAARCGPNPEYQSLEFWGGSPPSWIVPRKRSCCNSAGSARFRRNTNHSIGTTCTCGQWSLRSSQKTLGEHCRRNGLK
jgi:hypothetical protein